MNTELSTEYTKVLELHNSVGGLPTMTNDKIAVVAKNMLEVQRAKKNVGRPQSQTTNQLMTLTMLTDSPYRRMKQCLSQIDNKMRALTEIYFSLQKKQIRVEQYKVKGDALSMLKVEEANHSMENTRIDIENTLKDVALFQTAYEEIRVSNNISKIWDEMDAEKAEIDHHIKTAFRQSHRQMVSTGSIDVGNMEYLEQFGVHPQTAVRIIRDYIDTEEAEIAKGKAPTVSRLYDFLDSMVEMFHDSHEMVMERIGIKKLIKEELLHLEDKDDDNL
tara:strand:+ start:2757 stop:3581 length:825 start_codon:yes stop_codon:yes gene_type:complete